MVQHEEPFLSSATPAATMVVPFEPTTVVVPLEAAVPFPADDAAEAY